MSMNDILDFASDCSKDIISCFFVSVIAFIPTSFLVEFIMYKRSTDSKLPHAVLNAMESLYFVPVLVFNAFYLNWHDNNGAARLIATLIAVAIYALVLFLTTRKKEKESTPKAEFASMLLVLAVCFVWTASCTYIEYIDPPMYRWEYPYRFVEVGETSQGMPIVKTDMTDVEWQQTPESDCFSEIAYNEHSKVLYVRFRDSGAAYAYFRFPEESWSFFHDDDSLGAYYNDQIKRVYDCAMIEE